MTPNDITDLTKLIGIAAFDYTLYDRNCAHEWKAWLGSFKWYLKANHIEDDDEKFVQLMHLAGRKVQELYETLKTEDEENGTNSSGPLTNGLIPHLTEYEDALAKFNEFFSPKRNSTYERHVFRQIQQDKDEKFGMFLMRLRKQAERCNFGGNAEDNLKDQIIEKCRSPKLRRELLKLGDVDLNKVIKVANALEAVSEQEKDFVKIESKGHLSLNDVCNIGSSSKSIRSGMCTRCGFIGHQSFDDKCPAKGKRCNTCGGRDHFSRKCHTKKIESNWNEITEGSDLVKKRPSTEDVSAKSNQKKFKLEDVVKYVASEDEYEF